jgi:putative addiction module CopG family antidote
MLQVTLPPELEQSVESRIRSGRYQDVNAVMREALLALDAYEAVEKTETATEQLKALLDVGLQDELAGRLVDGPAAMRSLIKKYGG